MRLMIDQIRNYLNSLDTPPFKGINDYEVAQGIFNAIRPSEEKATGEALYEILCFELFPRHEGVSDWGTYYGSKASFRKDDTSDEVIEYPSLDQITSEAVDYWAKRAREAKHPILVERYADVAFEFSVQVGKTADRTLAQLVIDTAITICETDLLQDTYQIQKLYRARSLALRIRDTDRLNRLSQVVIDTERKIAEDNKPGLWGFSFEWLVLEADDKFKLDETFTLQLVKDLEDRLARLLALADPEPWNVERAVTLLLPYYIKQKNTTDAVRILLSLEDAYRRNKRANSDGMLKVSYLEQLDQLYRQYAALPGVRSHMERIAKELPEASKKSTESFQQVGGEIKIERKEIENYVKAIFSPTGQNGENPPTLKEVKVRIIAHFFGKREHAAKLVEKFSKEFVFLHIMQQRRLSVDGHTEVIIQPYKDDPESHIVSQAFQNLQISHIFLSEILEKFRATFTVQEMCNHLQEASLFLHEEKDYLTKALESYWSNDAFNTSHAFIPYIETLIRRLILRAGGVALRPNEYGGYSYKTLGTLLAENAVMIDEIFKAEVTFYLKLVLTHPLGWNLRNNYAHGVGLNGLFRQDIADRLFHIILLLSLVKIEKKPEDAKEEPEA